MADPAPRSALLISVGLSPQIVTETLHALMEEGAPLPDRLILLTTRRGEAAVREHLLDSRTGRIAAWGREWRVAGAAGLAARAELVLTDSPSGDVETARAVAHFTRVAARLIAELTADPASALHVSLAGGRKSAAAALAVLMALHGRPQDRLTHVLVEPEEAAGSDLFYPRRRGVPAVFAQGGRGVDPAAARVRLVDLPFVGLGGDASAAMAEALTGRLATHLGGPRLVINGETGRVTWDGSAHTWPPQPAAFLAMLVEDLKSGGRGLPRTSTPRARFFRHYARRARGGAMALPDPLDGEWMEEKASRVNRLARDCGIASASGPLVRREGRRSSATYRLALDPTEVALA